MGIGSTFLLYIISENFHSHGDVVLCYDLVIYCILHFVMNGVLVRECSIELRTF